MNLVIGWLTAGATLLAAIAAVASWRASVNANRSAQRLAGIELDRRHAELAPKFKLSTRPSADGDLYINVKLIGPRALSKLDDLKLRVRDDAQDPPRPITGHWSEKQLSAVVWGPYRFRPGVDGADENGRAVASIPLDLGNDRDFLMERTPAPAWIREPENRFWVDRHADAPIKLMLECSRYGDEKWFVPVELERESPRV